MTDRIPPPSGAATAIASASISTTTTATTSTSPSFAEAQRRLAARRQERAAEEAERRAQLAATAAAQREASAAALRARLEAGGPLSASSSSPVVRRIESTALIAWDGVTRAATTLHGALHGTSTESLDGSRPAFRVSQVDAELLDEELLELLRGQVADALQYIRGGTLQDDWQPEVMLLLRAALFKLSVWDHDATYGAALQNLRYADARVSARGQKATAVPLPPSKWQKAAYGLVTVGGRYAWTKWEDWLRDHDEEEDPYGEEAQQSAENSSGSRLSFLPGVSLSSRAIKRLARVTSVASDVYAGAAFVSFLVFLRYGRYRTLLDRVLRMRLVPPTSQVSREVSFEYLNRQLVWHAFTEFLLFLLPLVGINRWRRWLTRTWRKTKTAVVKATSAVKGVGASENDDSEAPAEAKEKKGELAFLPERTCAICYQDQNAATSEADIMAAAAASSGVIGSAETDITNPYEAVPCGCVYCYVSLATRIEREEGDGWTCLRCGTLVTSCRPWNGDVLEPASLSAANGAAIGGNSSGGGVDGRPSSSSTNASGSPSYTQKTVGFADDVKGVEEDEDDEENEEAESSNGEIQIDDPEGEEVEEGEESEEGEEVDAEEHSVDGQDDGEESAEASASDDESEAYEEDEDMEDEGDIDGEVE
ncbi:peroxisome assembly protein (Peroxin-2) [Sporothrix bragantina]|uniref:Peroxisome assembly protein (Peroxin-2) n=1 Tax=Sporothrix bragantina TaxID=671064 RepID=A0ABP0CQJ4_9PEZI